MSICLKSAVMPYCGPDLLVHTIIKSYFTRIRYTSNCILNRKYCVCVYVLLPYIGVKFLKRLCAFDIVDRVYIRIIMTPYSYL